MAMPTWTYRDKVTGKDETGMLLGKNSLSRMGQPVAGPKGEKAKDKSIIPTDKMRFKGRAVNN